MPDQKLTASYTAPDSQHVFSFNLPSSPNVQSVQDKTAYLHALRTRIGQMQSEVNVFLTKRMEEAASAADAGTSTSGTKARAQESKEEEMYGEEDPEGDA